MGSCALQMGTLGGGNHYAEIQIIDRVFDEAAARKMGIDQEGQACTCISPDTTNQEISHPLSLPFPFTHVAMLPKHPT